MEGEKKTFFATIENVFLQQIPTQRWRMTEEHNDRKYFCMEQNGI